MHTHDQQRLTHLLNTPEAQRLSPAAQQRLGWVVGFVASGDSISETCVRLGVARSTFHRWLERFDPNDLTTLEEKSHEPLNVRTSDVPDDVVAMIREERERSPLAGKERIREILKERGVDLSASTIGRIIERECLYFGSTPLHMRKRMRHQTSAIRSQNSELTDVWSLKSDVLPVTTSNAEVIKEKCDCLMCKLRDERGRPVRRFAVLTVMLVNLAFAAMMVGTAMWETNSTSLNANLNHEQTLSSIPVNSLDGR